MRPDSFISFDSSLRRTFTISILPPKFSRTEMDPNFTDLHFDLGIVYDEKGLSERAVSELQKAVQLSNRGPECLAALGHTYERTGGTREAREILTELQELQKKSHIPGISSCLL
jgi:tetratricopeptide (TPR) repeat protein